MGLIRGAAVLAISGLALFAPAFDGSSADDTAFRLDGRALIQLAQQTVPPNQSQTGTTDTTKGAAAQTQETTAQPQAQPVVAQPSPASNQTAPGAGSSPTQPASSGQPAARETVQPTTTPTPQTGQAQITVGATGATIQQGVQPSVVTPQRPVSRRQRDFPGQPVGSGPAGQAQPPQPQAIPGAPPPQPQPVSAPQAPARRIGAFQGQSGGMISLNFDDADVYSVIQTIFGEVLKVNYVVDSRVKGRVTFRSVAPVARDNVLPVMEVILRLNGIGVVEDTGLYRIVPLSDVSREPSPISFGRDPNQIPVSGKSVIQVVPMKYLQSTEVVKLITPFLSSSAVILDIPKSNQIVVVDTDASIRRMLQLVATFDNETQKQKRAQVYVYPVQNGKAMEIANLLQQIFLGTSSGTKSTTTTSSSLSKSGTTTTTAGQSSSTQSPPSQPTQTFSQQGKGQGGESLVSEITRIYSDETRNSIIILATPEDYDTIKAAIEKIDTTPRQVLIEGLIAEVNLSDDFTLGLAYAFKTSFNYHGSQITGDIAVNASSLAPATTTTATSSTSATTTTSTSSLPALTQGFSYVGVDTSGNARLLVNAIATNSKSKTLAAPHILVSDNREAHIQVGSQVPITTSTTINSGTTGNTTSTVQYKDIGIILKIKPQVNESGLVALEMSQEISALGDSVDLGNGQKEITINKTEAATNLVVHDGQTIIIGGLIREDHSKGFTGVPLLSKIPVLGYLFGTTSTKKIRNETIIFLTPHVIKNAEQAKSLTSDYMDRVTDPSGEGGLKREEILKGSVLPGSSIKTDRPKRLKSRSSSSETISPVAEPPSGNVPPAEPAQSNDAAPTGQTR